MCSPYLTGSLAVMLVIVAFNYWSVATENSELSKKLQEMQQQLKRGSEHIERLEVLSKYFCANRDILFTIIRSIFYGLRWENGL